MKKIVRKILVLLTIIAPIFSGNSCSDDKCGCSGDLQQSTTLRLKVSDLTFTGDSNHRSGYISDLPRYRYYTLCNPNETYSKIQEIGDYNLIDLEVDMYWNCQYAQRSQNVYYQYYNTVVYYDINVKNITPVIDG